MALDFRCDIREAGFSTQQAARIFAVQYAVSLGAITYIVPPWVINGTIWVESRFNQWAVSRVGASGLMQLMPATARTLSEANHIPNRPFEIEPNILMGTALLSNLNRWAEKLRKGATPERAERYRHLSAALGFTPTDWQLAHAAYFAGPRGITTKNRTKVGNYVRAVEKAGARFKRLKPFCAGQPDWAAPPVKGVRPKRPAPGPKIVRPTRPRPPSPKQPSPGPAQDGGGLLVALVAALVLVLA